MIAVIINAVSIVVGTFIGVIFRKIVKQDFITSLMKILGVVVLITGLLGVLKVMLYIDNSGNLQSRFELILLVIIVIGIFLGEVLKIDDRLQNFGKFLDTKFQDNKVSEGFISASLIFVVGAMSIIGSINAALGDNSILYLKSALDGVTAIILATTFGIGVGLSSVSVLVYQGLITIIGYFFGRFIPLHFIEIFNLIGYFIVTCIGINFLIKEKIKIANLLPSLVLVIIYYLIYKI